MAEKQGCFVLFLAEIVGCFVSFLAEIVEKISPVPFPPLNDKGNEEEVHANSRCRSILPPPAKPHLIRPKMQIYESFVFVHIEHLFYGWSCSMGSSGFSSMSLLCSQDQI